eukprot:6480013-Amphidinium_carterae.1
MSQMNAQDSIHVKIKMLPRVFKQTARNLARAGRNIPVKCAYANLRHGVQALWKLHAGFDVTDCLRLVPHWGIKPSAGGIGEKIQEKIAEYRERLLHERMHKYHDGDDHVTTSQKLKWMAIWAAWKRAQCPSPHLLLHHKGTTSSEPNHVVDALLSHWRPKFAMDPQLDTTLWSEVDPYIIRIIWPEKPEITIENIKEVIQCTHASSPGPDGVSYLHLKSSQEAIAPILLESWNTWLDEGTFHDALKDNNMVCISKTNDNPIRVDQTRPLVLANTMGKILCILLLNWLHPILNLHIHPCQKGFLSGRSLEMNIIELER